MSSWISACTVPPEQPVPVTGGSAGSGGQSSGAGGVGAGGGGGQGLQSTGGWSGGGVGGGGALGGQSGGGMGGGGAAGVQNTGGIGGGGAAGGGGSGGGTGGSGIPPTFDTVKFVFQNTLQPCVASDCHGGTHPELLVLRIDDQLHMRMTSYVSVKCGNIPVVAPGEPERSALVKILKGPCDNGVGEPIPRMPYDCVDDEFDTTCVPAEYIQAIEQWIANGAPQ